MLNVKSLLDAIIADYKKWNAKSLAEGNSYAVGHVAKMESGEILTYTEGKKYIKVILDNSVHCFIVNCHDDKKFKYGDILKPAGWATPARNQARGNLAEGDLSWIKWTGPDYLR